MKFGKTIAALAAVLALTTFSGMASAQAVTGVVSGRWNRVDGANISAQAMMFSLRDQALYHVDMTLHGRDHGTVAGLVTSMPKTGTVQYRLVGTYVRGPYGRTQVTARIVLNIEPVEGIGPQVPHVVGMFQCVLDLNPRIFAVEPEALNGSGFPPIPWMRPLNGHMHGRWWIATH